MLLAVLVIAVLALVVAFRRLPLAYGAYAGAALLVCIWSPVAGQPLKSLDRYTLTIFPLWMAAGAWMSERRPVRVTLLVERRRCWRSGHSSSRHGRGWHESFARSGLRKWPRRPGRNARDRPTSGGQPQLGGGIGRSLGLSTMGYAKGKSIVGLDIEPGYVAAVEARAGQVKVERAATAPLPAGIVRDGEVVDVETLAVLAP